MSLPLDKKSFLLYIVIEQLKAGKEMNLKLNVNSQLEVPLYQQLVDQIRAAVKQGGLVSGERLPTVQELTEELKIARGTVKRAYDELERLGLLEKVQGRGTFIRYQPIHSASRKEQAMAAIDALLDELDEMGLSPSEINIFLNLKLRERAEKEAFVRVAVVECNPENLSQMSEQLRHIPGVDLYSFLLDNIRQYPYKLEQGFDLVVTTATHADYLESVLPGVKVVRAALCLSRSSLAHIIKLRHGKKVGIIGYSRRFSELLYRTCINYSEHATICQPLDISAGDDAEEYLKDKDVLFVSEGYEKYFDKEVTELLSRFRGQLVECHYEMDEGSVLYLEVKIKRMMEDKNI